MNKRTLIALPVLILLGVGWYLFRPELLFIDATVNEEFPSGAASQTGSATIEPVVLLSGGFHGVAHETTGMATVYQLPDGNRVLRLTDFKTTNGPDLQLYLVAAEDSSDAKTVTRVGFVSLGALKGNEGDQNYDLPADIDLALYRSVTVWCRRFKVNFATAPLKPAIDSPTPLAQGRFHGVAHETEGVATAYSSPGGKRVLRLTQFETTNGPDLHVYLVAAADAKDNQTVKRVGFVTLGRLKGNIGDQNYELPEEVDLAKYRSVVIWCRRFGVNFGTAPLHSLTTPPR